MFLSLSFEISSLDRALLTTGLSAQQSKALGRSRSLLGDASFSSWVYSLRPSSDKARERTRLRNYSPVAYPPYPEDSLQLALAFVYLSIYSVPSFWLRICRYRSLTLEIPPTFARKKGGSKNIILNPLCILPETLSVLFVFFVSHC